MRRNQTLALALCAALAISGCSATGNPSPSETHSPVIASPVVPAPSPTEAPSPGPIHLSVGCSPTVIRCQSLPAGTYVTTGNHAFLPGLVVTLPAGWSSSEQDAGEFSLHTVGDKNRNDSLLFWHDIVAVDHTGSRAAGVGTAPQDLVDFLVADPRLIVSKPSATTIGNGLSALALTIRVDPAGPNDDPEQCPGDSCANFLTDPAYWEGPIGITVNSSEDASLACPCSHAVRLFLASYGQASDPHTLAVAVVVYAPDPDAELALFQQLVAPIIDSVRLPEASN